MLLQKFPPFLTTETVVDKNCRWSSCSQGSQGKMYCSHAFGAIDEYNVAW